MNMWTFLNRFRRGEQLRPARPGAVCIRRVPADTVDLETQYHVVNGLAFEPGAYLEHAGEESCFRSEHRRRFDEIAHAATAATAQYIDSLTDVELGRANDAIAALSDRNCAWDSYSMRDVFKFLCETRISSRARERMLARKSTEQKDDEPHA